MTVLQQLRENADRLFHKSVVWIGISFLIGLILGLFIGWELWPTNYNNAAPNSLQSYFQLDYLRMIIDSYAVNGDANTALSRFNWLGENRMDLLNILHNDPLMDQDRLLRFDALVSSSYVAGTEAPVSGTPVVETVNMQDVLSVLSILGIFIGGSIAVIIVINLRRNRGTSPTKAQEAPSAEGALSLETEEEIEDRSMPEEGPQEYENEPLERFVTTYAWGDDLYEDSFTINSPGGEFLGECGVGISEPIGVGEPRKITAFEVWLFDRKPSRTSTSVLMSQYAFQKDDLRANLAPRGNPVLAAPGADFWMETPGLQLRVVVRELQYGKGPLPQTSYFERLTLQLEVWAR
jgi:hypothetical protein